MKAPWLKDALIGVNSSPVFNIDGVMGEFIAKVTSQPIEPALAFAQAVGVWSACRKAAIVTEDIAITLPTEITQTNDRILANDSPITKILTQLLQNNSYPILAETFNLMQQHNLKLPIQLLPQALDAGRQRIELRPSLLAVLGTRGTWLAQFNHNWKYATSHIDDATPKDDTKLWEEGSQSQRETFFKHTRDKDAALARELLTAQLSKLPAKERLAFVELLEINLSLADEELLNSLLKDRSKEVKSKAIELLTQLPQSTYAQQIIVYVQTLITKPQNNWQCEAPTEFNEEWSKLGLVKEKPSSHSLGGERSWWLLQLLSKTPLDWWQSYTGMTPEELFEWSEKTDWAKILQTAWFNNITFQQFDWIALLIQKLPKIERLLSGDKLNKLLSKLNLQQWEQLASFLPSDISKHSKTLSIVIDNLPLGQMLPTKLSQTILLSFTSLYKQGLLKNDYWQRHFYKQVISLIAPSVLQQYQTIKQYKAIKTDDNNQETQWISELEQEIELRINLHQYFINE